VQHKRADEFSARYFYEQEIEEKRIGKVQGIEHPQTKETDRNNSKRVKTNYKGHHQLLLQIFFGSNTRYLVTA
jgi:hypothetical protein